jgi:hypothetical protein
MTRARVLAAVLAAALLAAAPGRAVTLRYKYKAGDKLTYRDQLALATDLSAGEGAGETERMQMRSDSRLRQVIKGGKDGVWTIEIETIENQTETMPQGGKTTKTSDKGDPERVRIDDRGLVAERKELGKEADKPGPEPIDVPDVLQQVLDHLQLPAGDVNPGDSWTDACEVKLVKDLDKSPTVNVSATSRFTRLVKVNGHECAEIKSTFEVPLKIAKPIDFQQLKFTADGKLMGDYTMYFALDLGQSLVELSTVGADVTFVPVIPKGPKVSLERRLKFNTKTVLEE